MTKISSNHEITLAVVLFSVIAIFAIICLFSPGTEGYRDPNVDFDIIDVPNGNVLNEDDYAEVFYNDRIHMESYVNDPDGDEIVEYEWIFECNHTGCTSNDDQEEFQFSVGLDHLYPGLDGPEPYPPANNSNPQDYFVTLRAHDEDGNVGEHTMQVMVFPLAWYEWTQEVIMGEFISEVAVELVWRGFQDEAAEDEQNIGQDTPVFLHIEETASPDPNLSRTGGLGKVFDIHSVGCYRQDGNEGFFEAEIGFPFPTVELEYYGDYHHLQDHVMLEWYDEVEERFVPVPDSDCYSDQGVKYAVGSVDHFSLFSAVIDVIYNESHPEFLNMRPDLYVYRTEFSRSPVLEGIEVEIRTLIKNSGWLHARNITVDCYDNETHIGEVILDLVMASGGTAWAIQTFIPVNIDTRSVSQDHDIRVIVNEDRTIIEQPDWYDNNEQVKRLEVIRVRNPHIEVNIVTPLHGSTHEGITEISGEILTETGNSTIHKVYVPFGKNDAAFSIEKVEGLPSVSTINYYLIDDQDNDVPDVNGSVAEIYGLNFDDDDTNISFMDNDRDGRISAGDRFHVKNMINGGPWQYDYTMRFEDRSPHIENIQLSFSGGAWMITTGTMNWSYQLDTTGYKDGNIRVEARAFDGCVFSETANMTFIIDNPEPNIPPIITIQLPKDGSKLSGKVMIEGTTKDEDGEVTKVEIQLDKNGWQAINGNTSWSFELDTTLLENGEITIELRCYDGEDYSNVSTITVTIENKDEDEGGGGFIPGFTFIMAVVVIASIAVVRRRK